MTKQHFIAFAAEIKSQLDGCSDYEVRLAAQAQCELVCKVAAQFNPRFDGARFRKACGL